MLELRQPCSGERVNDPQPKKSKLRYLVSPMAFLRLAILIAIWPLLGVLAQTAAGDHLRHEYQDDDWITVTPRGRFLVRAVCMIFDYHLRTAQARARYSKVI